MACESTKPSDRVTPTCGFCGNARPAPLAGFGGLLVGRCRFCGSGLVVNCTARQREEAADYSARYEEELDPRKARRCWNVLRRRIGNLAGAGSILDVGCGGGEFLDLAKAAGLRTAGVEIAPRAADAAADKGHVVYRGSILEGAIPQDASFDVVTLWDVLEHLPRPGLAIGEAYRALRPNGRLLALTPMMGSIYDRAGVALHRITRGRFDRLVRMCWTREHLYRFHAGGAARVLGGIGFDEIRVEPILLLSLGAERYAGGGVLPAWGPRAWVNRLLSLAGVFAAQALNLCNKILISARKPA
jgi:SAM-dependent methyltransferase